MHTPTLETAVRRIRTLTAPVSNDTSDRELLKRFLQSRDETAFAGLVKRHGPTVLGVCRRVLNHQHDAEDAFQATFLVLSRRAASIQKHGSVGCWLHGVAFRVARKLKLRLAKQKRAPVVADVPSQPNDDVSWSEIRRILDEEVNRLPESLRMPVLLCYFEGKTRDEAAETLGWKLTTLRGRLEDGRDRLRIQEYVPHLKVKVDGSWKFVPPFTDTGGGPNAAKTFELKPGKHRLRVSYPVPGAREQRVISQMVEIEAEKR